MDNGILEFLRNMNNYYIDNNYKEIKVKDIDEFSLSTNLILYKLEKVIFDEELSRREAMKNILSSIRVEGINFVYLILGNKEGVNFYLGVSKDLYSEKKLTFEINDICSLLLKPNIKGNLKEVKIIDVTVEQKLEIYKTIDKMSCFSILEGVAGRNESDEKLKYIDKLVNIMNGDDFGFMLIARPLDFDNIRNIENNLSKLYDEISYLSNKVVTKSTAKTFGNDIAKSTDEAFTNVISTSISILNAISESTGGNNESGVTAVDGNSETVQRNGNNGSRTSSNSETIQDNARNPIETRGRTETIQNNRNSSNTSVTISQSTQERKKIGENWSKSSGTTNVELVGYSKSNTTNSSITEVSSNADEKSTSITVEYVNKEATSWIEYINDVLFKRLDYGKGSGLFVITTFLFSNENIVLSKLANIIKIPFAGDSGNKVPMKSIVLNKEDSRITVIKKFQVPQGNFTTEGYIDNPLARSAISQYINDNGNGTFGNWISANELSLIIGVPQKN